MKPENAELRKLAVSLIRLHYDKREDVFLETAREVANWFDKNNGSQAASYIRVLTGDEKNVFVPFNYPTTKDGWD